MLVDGGHAETGEQVVAHLRRYFGPNPVLEHVVLTHSDADHASGLRTVLETVAAKSLWLHIPWGHAAEALPLFADKRLTAEGLARKLMTEYDVIDDIVRLAHKQGCNVTPAFQGSDIGPFRVLSPSRGTYVHLVPQFERTPDADRAAIERAGLWIGKASVADRLFEAARSALQGWTTERWDQERLRDGGITSASNESSVVMYGWFDNGPVLLTGDAGLRGLTWAADAADAYGLPLRQFSFVQVPHHGSRRNSAPAVLDRLVGPIQPENFPPRFAAFVSAPKDGAKHPRRIVLNAFKRRGGRIIATQGSSKIHWGGFPVRDGYGPAENLPFFTRVEEYT
ncbi:MBL fold metallo-hydrolase [Methylorubrum populi]|nr:MBL fold metallo-hydrolase [Methylorubrum populi]